jgi:uncharacterized sporulation protein YeaH/YhbH (DUF444 family)
MAQPQEANPAYKTLSIRRTSPEDWKLQRKGATDRKRFEDKIWEAVENNLDSIVSGNITAPTPDGKMVRVPIQDFELPRFRYDFGRNKHVGQGEGNSKPGDQIGKGSKAGDKPGHDYLVAELPFDRLAAILFKDWELPGLKPKQSRELEEEHVVWNEVRKRGQMSNLDKRRTILQNIKRNALAGKPRFKDVNEDDLRFRTFTPVPQPDTDAVILAMRDVSGSMGDFEQEVSETFYFWMLQFLQTKYPKVDTVFITHHTQAKEVDRKTFFTLGESGWYKSVISLRKSFTSYKRSI